MFIAVIFCKFCYLSSRVFFAGTAVRRSPPGDVEAERGNFS